MRRQLDIFQLQLAKTEEFITASNLLVKKWLAVEGAKHFVDYFNTEYMIKYSGWYEGIAPKSPSTNNCLESTNNVLKKECSLRERLLIREFILRISEKLRTWSELIDPASPNYKDFSLLPDLPLQHQKDSYNWARGNVGVKRRVKSGATTFYIPADGKLIVQDGDIQQYEKQTKTRLWKLFDKYAATQTKLWKVVM
jgi:hypothetical protein